MTCINPSANAFLTISKVLSNIGLMILKKSLLDKETELPSISMDVDFLSSKDSFNKQAYFFILVSHHLKFSLYLVL